MDFVVEKIEKATKNLERALNNIENGELRLAIADLRHAEENSTEGIYILLAELEEMNKNGKWFHNGWCMDVDGIMVRLVRLIKENI